MHVPRGLECICRRQKQRVRIYTFAGASALQTCALGRDCGDADDDEDDDDATTVKQLAEARRCL